jgi:hypothetical protein
MKASCIIIAGVVLMNINTGQARIGQAQTAKALAEKSGCLVGQRQVVMVDFNMVAFLGKRI